MGKMEVLNLTLMLGVCTLLCLLNPGEALIADTEATLQQQLDVERQARIQLEGKFNQLQGTLDSLVVNLQTECSLKCPVQKSVAFMAQLSATLANPANGHVVVFDDVITNAGTSYNKVHGIFTTPVNGTYNFNLIASSPYGAATHQIHLLIKKNSATVGYIFLDWNEKFWLRRSTDVTLHMVTGDEIWVEVAGVTGAHSLGGCCFHTHLSGFLIQAD